MPKKSQRRYGKDRIHMDDESHSVRKLCRTYGTKSPSVILAVIVMINIMPLEPDGWPFWRESFICL